MKIKDIINLFEEYLQFCISQITADDNLNEALSYALNSGGKRARPIMLLTLISALDSKHLNEALPVATALEFIHTYSLVHDDLPAMDDDDFRRGRLSVHKQYDEATAILVGDALLTEAFHLLSKAVGLSEKKRLALVTSLSKAAGVGGMIGGQYLDIISAGKVLTIEQLQHIHRLKTGALFEWIGHSVSIIIDLPHEDQTIIIKLLSSFGLAFQIHNDLIDATGNKQLTGKLGNSDDENKTVTYPKVIGLKDTKYALNQEIDKMKHYINLLECKKNIKLDNFNYFIDLLTNDSK